MTRLLALALALASTACLAYPTDPPPEVPERAVRPLRIYVVAGDWDETAEFAEQLQAAGFVPTLVAHAGQVPPDAPWIEHARVGENMLGDCSPLDLLGFLTVLSLGVVPGPSCERFGSQFDLHRSAAAPAQPIDTVWKVPTIQGWLVLPVGLLPGWTARPYFVSPELVGSYPVRALRTSVLDALGAP